MCRTNRTISRFGSLQRCNKFIRRILQPRSFNTCSRGTSTRSNVEFANPVWKKYVSLIIIEEMRLSRSLSLSLSPLPSPPPLPLLLQKFAVSQDRINVVYNRYRRRAGVTNALTQTLTSRLNSCFFAHTLCLRRCGLERRVLVPKRKSSFSKCASCILLAFLAFVVRRFFWFTMCFFFLFLKILRKIFILTTRWTARADYTWTQRQRSNHHREYNYPCMKITMRVIGCIRLSTAGFTERKNMTTKNCNCHNLTIIYSYFRYCWYVLFLFWIVNIIIVAIL